MSSTILYKFRASSTFEALPLPGSAARLFDVKKAIVKANKLDTGSMEFDLAVRNADTNEEYADESMLLPRGTRIIVQRLPAARGHGFLARMVRNEHGGGIGSNNTFQHQQHPSGYYTIDNRTRENEEEEFVETSGNTNTTESNDDMELAALQAVTSLQPDGPTMVGGRSMMGGHRGGRGGPRQPAGMGPPPNFHHNKSNNHYRLNADPELREQEKKLMPKKRATGIPRTFLNLSAPPQTDSAKEGGENDQTPLLQPNKQGFEELVNRGGGQSERTTGTRRDLDYVLKLTSTTVPEHLQCAICDNVVKKAMLLPWDTEGRTVCETCIRDALTQNGFRCPLTGMDGVSPDDLIPNVGLRKAAELFIKGVMENVDEIEKQQVEELVTTTEDSSAQSSEKNILDGEGVEKGVIVSKRMSFSNSKKSDDDPFGGGDFGGDVFAVEAINKVVVEPKELADKKESDNLDTSTTVVGTTDSKPESNTVENTEDTKNSESKDIDTTGSNKSSSLEIQSIINEANNNNKKNDEHNELSTSTESSALKSNNEHSSETSTENNKPQKSQPVPTPPSSHMRFHRRRGPPVGYAMGPAGGAVVTSARVIQPINDDNYHGNNGQNYPGHMNNKESGFSRGGRGRGRFLPRGGGGGRHGSFNHDHNIGGGPYGRDRGGRGRGRGRGRFDVDQQDHRSIDEDSSRGIKRSRDDHRHHQQNSDGFRHEGGGGGRGRGPYGRNGYRGGRGGGRSWGGQRGNFQGSRGSYGRDRGRGRF